MKYLKLSIKKIVDSIFYGHKNSFDSVDHNILLSKVAFFGIRGKFKKIIIVFFDR
jgi:hypothetical protein